MMSRTEAGTPACPKCGRAIDRDDVNVAIDVAYCRPCNLALSLSRLVHATELTGGVEFSRPPAGVHYSGGGSRLVVKATHRTIPGAIGALAVALFWNGIVSVFVLVNTASTLSLMHVPVPAWFPAPEMNGDPMGLGMTLFLWVFLTPFIVIGLGMIGAFLVCIAGKTEVRIENRNGIAFMGVGPLGYRQRFEPSSAADVRIEDQRWRDSDGDSRRKTCIVLETQEGKLIRFGSSLTEERRRFVAAAVRKAVLG